MLKQFSRRLWVRASLIGGLGVLAAILAAFVERYLPWQLPGEIGADAVDSILEIIASSMLAVTTFSLSVMTTAYGTATSNVTPRATRLLMEDRVTQNVLSTFVGSFLFAIVGIVVLKTGAYGDRGRVILFLVTIGVIVLIVVSLLRWIDYLTRFGRVGETTNRVEDATRKAIEARREMPYLGGTPMADPGLDVPAGTTPVNADRIGYVQHLDMMALSDCAEALDCDIFVVSLPGAFVYPHMPLAKISGLPSDSEEAESAIADLRRAFSIGDERSFDQDPRFGLVVMSEIASRALSSAINDPGTAIDVIGRLTRLMSFWAGAGADAEAEAEGEPEIRYPRVHVRPLVAADLFDDAFMALARDGAGVIEVQLRLQKTLTALGGIGDADFRAAARRQSTLSLKRAEAALTLEEDLLRLREGLAATAGLRIP